jgi:hypothetical protein
MEIGIEEQRVIIETISTLINIKTTLIDLILKPAGVPAEIYVPLFQQIDPLTGKPLSKRKIAPLILESLKVHPDQRKILRSITKIAANWNDFSLAHNEFEARATVQKAKEVLKQVDETEIKEQRQLELSYQAEGKSKEIERQKAYKREAELLLRMFDDLSKNEDHQGRGFLLQNLLNRLFILHEITVHRSFTRNQGGEQIDGAFKLEGWFYLVECRWREKLADIRQLDGLLGQIERSGKQTGGLFLSLNGWSENVIPLLKQNPNKSIFLMDGYDLRCALDETVDLRDFLTAKIAALNLETEPHLGVYMYNKLLKDQE